MELTFDNPHSFEEAKRRLENLCAWWNQRFGLSIVSLPFGAEVDGDWSGIPFHVEMTITDDEIRLEGPDLPLVYRAIVVNHIKKKVREYLEA